MARAKITVTLIVAIWGRPEVFEGFVEITPLVPGRSATFLFRAEAEHAESGSRFTELRRKGTSQELWAEGEMSVDSALAILSFALQQTVALLRRRTLERFSRGQGPALAAGLEDLGFQVELPFDPQDEQSAAGLAALLS